MSGCVTCICLCVRGLVLVAMIFFVKSVCVFGPGKVFFTSNDFLCSLNWRCCKITHYFLSQLIIRKYLHDRYSGSTHLVSVVAGTFSSYCCLLILF